MLYYSDALYQFLASPQNIPAKPVFGLPVKYTNLSWLFTRQSWLFMRENLMDIGFQGIVFCTQVF